MRTDRLRTAIGRGALVAILAAGTLATAGGGEAGAQAPVLWEADLAEGQRLFNEQDYEHAVPYLTRAILVLEPMAPQQPTARTALVTAYGLRARALFGLDDVPRAQDDFRALLALEPSFALGGQISPRVVSLFESVRAAVVGALALTVDPPDAAVELDGRPMTPTPAGVPLTAGEYTLAVTRIGYRPAEEKVTVLPGETKQFAITLERTSSVVFFVTVPPGVDVIVDGLTRGQTVAGPLAAEYADVPAQLGVAPELVSQPLVLGDLTQGSHTVQFRKACYATEERRLAIEKPEDYRQEPVHLESAVGALAFESTPPGATVFVDGERRGTTPTTIDDVCEGTRAVEMRGSNGRVVQRVTMKAGETVQVRAALKPAFALLPAGSGVQAGLSDRRAEVERALAGSQQVTVFVPGGREAEAALKVAMPPEWLAFDAGRRPVGGAAALTAAARRDLSAKFARALDVQGIAAVTQPAPGSPDLVVALLAAGAGEPDVVSLTLERVDSVNRATARLDALPPLSHRGIGLLAADVLDATGLVVVRVDAGSAAEKAGIKAGDLLIRADGQALADTAQLQQVLEAKQPGDAVAIETHDPAGTARTTQLPVIAYARLMSPTDETLLFNPISLALRARLAAADPREEPLVRLNLGVALLRLGDYAGAREQFAAVELPAGPGISLGTREYLVGLLYEHEGDVVSARKSFQAAAEHGGLLTEDGPSITALAARKLGGVPRGPAVR